MYTICVHEEGDSCFFCAIILREEKFPAFQVVCVLSNLGDFLLNHHLCSFCRNAWPRACFPILEVSHLQKELVDWLILKAVFAVRINIGRGPFIKKNIGRGPTKDVKGRYSNNATFIFMCCSKKNFYFYETLFRICMCHEESRILTLICMF